MATVTGSLQHLFDTVHLPKSHLYSEICVLRQRLSQQQQQQQQQRTNDCIEGQDLPLLPDFLESTLTGDGQRENCLTPEECLQRLLEITKGGEVTKEGEITKEGKSGTDGGKVCSCLLTTEQRVRLSVVKSLLKGVREQQPGRWSEVVNHLTKEPLPVEMLWQMHVDNLLPLPDFFDRALRERTRCTQLTEQLLELSSVSQDQAMCRQILSGVCSHLVKTGFPEKKSEDSTLRKVCIGILDGVTRGLLDHQLLEKEPLLHTDLLRSSAEVSHVSFKKFCTHTVSLIMSHRPNMKVSEALKRQADWKSGKIPDSLKMLFKQLLVPFDSGEVVEILRRILEKQEVNWQTLLSYLATFLVCFPGAASDVQEHVTRLLADSLESGDMENTIVSFLLARQSCAEGAHVFPAYPQWFQEVFGDGSRSPAGSKKTFTFLIKFLTDLVPFEPADLLKVHILRPPFIPAKCRDLWTDYTFLAKTRLADLKVPLEEVNTAIYADQGNSVQATPGLQDVERAVAAFESSGKVPTTVMEASIFRKPYFVGKFLPALLHPRHLPDTADSRMRFIEALKKAGKIPSSLFTKYEEACRKETKQLLEGVFEVDEDDGVEEMLMEPLQQLSHRLKQLTDAVLGQSTETRVSEIVSVVSEKIEIVLGVGPVSDVSAASACVLDLCQPSLSTSHVQVVDEVLNCVCRTHHSAKDSTQQQWLPQLVRMLSQHFTLHPALFVRLLMLFTSKNEKPSDHHVEGAAAFVFHLTNSHSLFRPLYIQKHDSGEKQGTTFLHFFCHSLPVSSARELLVTQAFLTTYLKTAFLCLHAVPAACSEMAVILPRWLTVLFALVNWRLLPKTGPVNSAAISKQLPWQQRTSGPEQEACETVPERLQAVASAVYFSEKFQDLLTVNQPTLENWVDLELRVSPASDSLSPLQRQTYQHSMMSRFCVDGDKAGTSHTDDLTVGLPQCCSLLMKKLTHALSRCQRDSGKCPRCHQSSQFSVTDTDVSPKAVTGLLTLLAKLVGNLPATSSDEAEEAPWLVRQVLSLVRQSPAEHSVVPQAVLRVLLSCPAYLLFTNSAGQRVSQKSMSHSVQFTEEFLMPHASQGGVLSLDVICHILQGYVTVLESCRDRGVIKPFQEHPLIVLSTLVHWRSVCALVPSLSVNTSPWDTLSSLLAACHRFFEERQLSPPHTTTSDSFCLAAAVYASLADRCWNCDPESRKELVHQLHQVQPKAVSALSSLLLVSLSDDQLCCWGQLQKADAPLLLLSEVWSQFPHLISSVSDVSNDSEAAALRRALMPADQLPFSELVVLRCVGNLAPEKIAGEKGVLPVIVRLFARLCQRFDDSDTFQRGADVGVVMELSKMVLTVMKMSPWSVLHSLDVEEIKLCGLEFFRLYQQRVSSTM